MFNIDKIFTEDQKDLFLIAGPCVIETEDIIIETASRLKEICNRNGIGLIFKSSYRKANRSSIESFQGPGLTKGLDILAKVKEEFGLPVLTDIHLPSEVNKVAQVVDILQIPAFLFRQTDLLVESGRSGKPVNIKKGQFGSANEMKLAAEKVRSTGNNNIILTERGTTFGYNNLVVDFRNFMDMSNFGLPIVYDVTHSLQRPAAEGNISGGQPEYVRQMAMAAIATGAVNGLFIETHPDPKEALSDSRSMIKLDKVEKLLEKCIEIKKITG